MLNNYINAIEKKGVAKVSYLVVISVFHDATRAR